MQFCITVEPIVLNCIGSRMQLRALNNSPIDCTESKRQRLHRGPGCSIRLNKSMLSVSRKATQKMADNALFMQQKCKLPSKSVNLTWQLKQNGIYVKHIIKIAGPCNGHTPCRCAPTMSAMANKRETWQDTTRPQLPISRRTPGRESPAFPIRGPFTVETLPSFGPIIVITQKCVRYQRDRSVGSPTTANNVENTIEPIMLCCYIWMLYI